MSNQFSGPLGGLPTAIERRPHVASFYSYKGGVGRTLLAANVAASLARRGKTLIWDLDVEAPGIQFIPALSAPGRPKYGFLEWLKTWQDTHFRTQQKNINDNAPRVTETQTNRFLGAIHETSVHQLYCLAALGDDVDPAPVYGAIDWNWLQRDPGQAVALFELLLQRLYGAGFRYIIIDSRTGYTDLGALLIGLVPDITVLVGGYGDQNLKGLVRIWKALKNERPELLTLRSGRKPPRLEIVASPIPEHNVLLAMEGKRKWARAFDLEMSSAFEIPYDPELPFSEKLLVVAEPDRRIAKRYEAVATALADHFDAQEAEIEAQARALAHWPDLFHRDGRTEIISGSTFEQEVARVLRLLGYQTEPTALTRDASADFEARIRVGLDEFRYLVECKGGRTPTTSKAVEQVIRALRSYHEAGHDVRGMVISNSGFSAAALHLAKEKEIRLFSLQDLEDQLLDFHLYLDNMLRDFERATALDDYIVQRAKHETLGERALQIDDLVARGVNWARGEGTTLWLVLGSPGSGKSTFASRFCYELAVRAKRDERAPVPLLVRLSGLTVSHSSLGQLLSELWWQATDERKDPQLFLHLLNRGRIVVLLDGLDEMVASSGIDDRTEVFRHLVGIVAEPTQTTHGNRVLLTCRDNLFAKPRLASLEAEDGDKVVRLKSVAQSLGADISTLEPLEHDQILGFLARRLSPAHARTLASVVKQTDLKGIADNPLLLEFVASSSKEWKSERVFPSELNVEAVFEKQIIRWHSRASTLDLGTKDLRFILEAMAAEMWRRRVSSLHLGDVFQLLIGTTCLSGDGDADIQVWDTLLRSSPFLASQSARVYTFSHRSLQDFLLAWYIAGALDNVEASDQLGERMNGPRLTTEVVQSLLLLVPVQSDQIPYLRVALLRLLSVANGIAHSSGAARVNALVTAHAFAVRDAGDNPTYEDVRRTCQFYIPDGAKLENAVLKGLVLDGVHLREAFLSGADMDEVDLTGADLSGAMMDKVSLRGARLLNTLLAEASLVRADFSKAIVRGVSLVSVDAAHTKWVDATLSDVRLDGISLRGADFRDAVLVDDELRREIDRSIEM